MMLKPLKNRKEHYSSSGNKDIDENYHDQSSINYTSTLANQQNIVERPSSADSLTSSLIENQPSGLSEFPKAVFFIIGTEFCERFSFYGMKTILYKYFRDYLGFSEGVATANVHSFVMLAYFFPLLGGALSDSWLGKFKTIVYLSLIYSLGNVILALTSIPGVTGDPPHWWGACVGLFLLALGTGGIKPCVSAFGADQFRPSQTEQIQLFFSMFYFAINFGSVLSTFITPEIRAISCFGYNECYVIAFGLPAALMVVATLIFLSGSSLYKKNAPSGNVLFCVVGVVWSYFSCLLSGTVGMWKEIAARKYGREIVEETSALSSVLIMFLPLPIFWALFDQQSTRWVAQAEVMDRDLDILGFKFTVKSDQMQILNAILILVMIPLFERIVYPILRKLGVPFKPLSRMVAGMILTGSSFVIAALLQMKIDDSEIVDEKCVKDCVRISWQIPQYIVLTAGEILFSITGLEFAYSEAPKSMKSVSQACFQLTVAFGNLIVVLVAGSKLFNSQTLEFLFFAFAIFFAAIIFMIMSYFYVGRSDRNNLSEEEENLLLGSESSNLNVDDIDQ